jgi:hypothetical protein
MPAESLAGAEGLAERGEVLAHRGHHGGTGVDETAAPMSAMSWPDGAAVGSVCGCVVLTSRLLLP